MFSASVMELHNAPDWNKVPNFLFVSSRSISLEDQNASPS
jgi:hypothetical protein